MDAVKALAGGLAGACAVTLVNETARQFVDDAPRLDLEGERFVSKGARRLGLTPPEGNALYGASMGFDLISNGLYYSLAAIGDPRTAPLKGALLGLVGGVANVVVAPAIGLGKDVTRKNTAQALMSIAWYTAGGLAAGAAYRLLRRR